jgi:hypothetical protein
MSRSLRATRPAALFALALCAASAACNNPFALPPATLPPVSATLVLFAMTGTPLETPSAFDMVLQLVARTDRTSQFDFAFDIQVDSVHDTTAVLYPRGALGLFRDGGIQTTLTPYDSITIAPTNGYEEGAPVTVKLGSVVLVASRVQSCNFGFIRPLYMKLQVTTLDLVARSITFKTLLDPNCGYRSLRPSTLPPTE